MSNHITGHTGLLCLLGSPVAHSVSPEMHNEACSQLGLDYTYLAFDVPEEKMPQAVEGLRTMGARGWNITMPGKNIMCKLADKVSPASEISGACNTIVNDDGVLTAYTTDGVGFMRAVAENGVDIIGKKMTLLGAGGAATAILVQAALDGVAEINVFNVKDAFYPRAEEITVQPKEESQPKITQYMLETSGRNKLSDLAQIIIGEGYKRVMVFCDTKFNTAALANQLARLGFSVDCLHGDLSQNERNRIMQNFRDGKLNVLVATDVAARGIDVSDVDAVINYDVPGDNEHYTHRIGRTGRAKKEGVSYLFYVPEEKKRVQELLRLTRNTDLCTPVHFDFNHEHIVVEKKQDSADRFQIKCYF